MGKRAAHQKAGRDSTNELSHPVGASEHWTSPRTVRGAIAVVAFGLATSLVALFQWAQLISARSGGTSVCSINQTFDCVAVWSVPFASAVHRWTGLPIAGWGLVWALSVTAQGLTLLYRLLLRQHFAAEALDSCVAALRLTAIAGALSSVVLAVVSLASHVVCPTCLLTYVLVGGFVATVYLGLPRPAAQGGELLRSSVTLAGVPTALAFAALLVPGLKTPHAGDADALPSAVGGAATPTSASPAPASEIPGTAPPASAAAGAASTPTVSPGDAKLDGGAAEVLASFTQDQKLQVADALAAYRAATPVAPPASTGQRLRYGPKDAAVKLVEWTDIRCGHCRHLVEAMGELKRLVPSDDKSGRWSVEPRHFPLDGACNPHVQIPDALGVRCLAAKVQICLEGQPDYWELQHKLFEAQGQLDSSERLFQLAGSGKMSVAKLRECSGSAETAKKLSEDIEYAATFHPEGTPILALNGKAATPSPPFLLLMILLGGRTDAPLLSTLPSGTPPAAPR